MLINTQFQQQAADLIIGLLKANKVRIKETISDLYEDRKIFLFQLFSRETAEEICILQQIIFTNNEKAAYIYIRAQNQNWPENIVQSMLDIVFEKSEKSPSDANENPKFFY